MSTVIEMHDIVKRYGTTLAVDQVSLSIAEGQIHAILGENGAGKSTLMKILYGEEHPDSGSIFLKGQQVINHSPRLAMHYGLGMVHQNFMLIPDFTLLENISLGKEPTRFRMFCDYRSVREKTLTTLSQLGISLALDKPIKHFSVEEMQIIEIAKLLYHGADILILDEPTSVLSPQRIDSFLDILINLRNEGKTIVLITHKLAEVFRVVDTISVMRKGRLVANFNRSVQMNDVIKAMVGQETSLEINRSNHPIGNAILRLVGVSITDNHKAIVDDLSLEVREGEIVGITGVGGNGQKELVEAIVGLRNLTKGEIYLNDEDITLLSIAERRRRGIVYVPGDRLKLGSAASLSIKDNAIIGHHRSYPIAKKGFIDPSAALKFTRRLIDQFGIVVASPVVETKSLSGGNLQKLILARELSFEAKLIIVEYPSQGIDVRTTYFIYQTLLSLKQQKLAILLFSNDLDEVLSLSDRLGVLFRGRLSKIVKPDETDRVEIGQWMIGKAGR